jgi:hypothetical protein
VKPAFRVRMALWVRGMSASKVPKRGMPEPRRRHQGVSA